MSVYRRVKDRNPTKFGEYSVRRKGTDGKLFKDRCLWKARVGWVTLYSQALDPKRPVVEWRKS